MHTILRHLSARAVPFSGALILASLVACSGSASAPIGATSASSSQAASAAGTAARTCQIPDPKEDEGAGEYAARIHATCHAGNIVTYGPNDTSGSQASAARVQAPKASSLNAEAITLAESYLRDNHGLITCGERTFAYVTHARNPPYGYPVADGWRLVELKDLRLVAQAKELKEADKLNGIDFIADIQFHSSASIRGYETGGWTDWQPLGLAWWEGLHCKSCSRQDKGLYGSACSLGLCRREWIDNGTTPASVRHKNGQWEFFALEGQHQGKWLRSGPLVHFIVNRPGLDCSSIPKNEGTSP